MGRKARERLMRGQRRAKPDQVVYGYQDPRLPKQPLTPARRALLMSAMRQASESDREAVREALKADGSEKALALLAEFERGWEAAIGQTTTTPPAR